VRWTETQARVETWHRIGSCTTFSRDTDARGYTKEGVRHAATAFAPSIHLASREEIQAHHILQFGFTVAPILAGLDKFFHLLVNWDRYLAPRIAALLPVSGHAFMLIVGVVEMAAGIIVALRPRLGGYLVAAWL